MARVPKDPKLVALITSLIVSAVGIVTYLYFPSIPAFAPAF